MMAFDFSQLQRANPQATKCRANIRLQPEHFRVDEQLPFEPSGEGGHAMLLIEKSGSNTDWVAKQLARFAGVEDVAIGYAGLKDRHAVTTQWFTVKLEGYEEPDWSLFSADDCQIKTLTRHNKKLKRGVLSGNQFSLILTGLEGDRAVWEQTLDRIQTEGVPNYFAEQRFGRQFSNLDKARQWFETGRKPKKRQQRSMILSAARSWLFNQVLSTRISQQNWQTGLAGDVMQLAGSSSIFMAESIDESIAERLKTFDIDITGPLWGRGRASNQADSLALESSVLEPWQIWQQGLEQAGLKQERRPLRVLPQNMSWQFDDESLSLSFFLPSGAYATAVMRELAEISDVSQRNSQEPQVSQL
jgi:tRNA pseudouridine13 synthase